MKNLVKQIWLLIVLAEIALCSTLIVIFAFRLGGATHYSSNKNPTASPVLLAKQAGQAGSGLPIRLKIAKINIDAGLESVGITPGGEVDVPKNPVDAAWYNLSSRPGDKGSAVIIGHYGPWKNGGKSVFDDLNKLKKGDRIKVENEAGIIVTFVVQELRTYRADQTAPEVFGSGDGKAHLNLITCSGVWNQNQKNYADRLVVFTDKQYE